MRGLGRICGTSREPTLPWAFRRRWRPQRAAVGGAAVLLGPVTRWSRNQGIRPSCGGQATSAILEALYPELPRLSAVDIWRGARRRLGLSLEDLSRGTRWSAIWSELEERGVDDWRVGEDEDPVEGGAGASPAGDNLRDELRAHDRRGLVRVYRTVPRDVRAALAGGLAVGISTGVRDPYLSLRADEVATTKHLGGNDNGHAQRVVGLVVIDGRELAVLGNWWGAGWAGCHVGTRWLPGHAFADVSIFEEAWQIWAVERARAA